MEYFDGEGAGWGCIGVDTGGGTVLGVATVFGAGICDAVFDATVCLGSFFDSFLDSFFDSFFESFLGVAANCFTSFFGAGLGLCFAGSFAGSDLTASFGGEGALICASTCMISNLGISSVFFWGLVGVAFWSGTGGVSTLGSGGGVDEAIDGIGGSSIEFDNSLGSTY